MDPGGPQGSGRTRSLDRDLRQNGQNICGVGFGDVDLCGKLMMRVCAVQRSDTQTKGHPLAHLTEMPLDLAICCFRRWLH